MPKTKSKKRQKRPGRRKEELMHASHLTLHQTARRSHQGRAARMRQRATISKRRSRTSLSSLLTQMMTRTTKKMTERKRKTMLHPLLKKLPRNNSWTLMRTKKNSQLPKQHPKRKQKKGPRQKVSRKRKRSKRLITTTRRPPKRQRLLTTLTMLSCLWRKDTWFNSKISS